MKSDIAMNSNSAAEENSAPKPRERHFPWVELCALLSVAQVLGAGYRFGVGNQAIQVTFLKRLIDRSLFPNDPLLDTFEHYPTFFFNLLAPFVNLAQLPAAYFILHCLTAFAVLAGCYLLSQAMFRSRAAGIVAVLLLAAGHHQALASTGLYWPGFTHTWAVFPLAIFILAFFFRGWLLAAFVLTGALFNLHALTALYLMSALMLWLVVDCRNLGWRRIAVCLAGFALPALPALITILTDLRQGFDAEWLRLVRIRSASHSFPLTWWRAGNAEIPRFAAILGLAALALGFRPPRETLRKILVVGGALLLLFTVGFLGSEVWPFAPLIRAQPFRASRILLLLALIVSAHGIVGGWQSLFPRRDAEDEDAPPARWIGVLELLTAGLVLGALALPALIVLLPAALLLGCAVALLRGRLSKLQAAVAGLALAVCVAAWRSIDVPLIAFPSGLLDALSLQSMPAVSAGGWEFRAAVCAIPIVFLGAFLSRRLAVSLALRIAAIALSVVLLAAAYPRVGRPGAQDSGWIQAQRWARDRTPPDAKFLTPLRPGAFRLHSNRAIVGEWRDGTQQYFDPEFNRDWWKRMQQLAPEMLYDTRGAKALSPGKALADLSDERLSALGRKYGAKYIVLPQGRERDFIKEYENKRWVIYRNEFKAAFEKEEDVWLAQQQFMQSTVLPNIEKHRKSDVLLRVVDAEGRPLNDVSFEIRQTDSLFRFGSALEFFVDEPPGQPGGFCPRRVHDKVLEYFPQLFNFSVIGYSGKWNVMEPERGEPDYEDLDRYVDWCTSHGVEIQFHYLSGSQPKWVRALSTDEKTAAFEKRARELVERYGKHGNARIASWQVVNNHDLLHQAPAVFKAIRELNPDLKLGVSACTVLGVATKNLDNTSSPSLRGMKDIRWLNEKGAKVDFYANHGHRPDRDWSDARGIYVMFDALAREDVRVYVTEFCVPLTDKPGETKLKPNFGDKMKGVVNFFKQGVTTETTKLSITGSVTDGYWDEELQGDYYARVFTVCFSHPACDGVNIWGMGRDTWKPGSGLLDYDLQPKPAFHQLKKLITESWRTRLDGRTNQRGDAAFRGFHGTYEVTLHQKDETGAGAKSAARAQFTVRPESANRFTAVWDSASGALNVNQHIAADLPN